MIGTLFLFAAATVPALPPSESFSASTHALTSTYVQCRNQGVGGVWLEGTGSPADVASMIANRKSQCRTQRSHLRRAIIEDLKGKMRGRKADSLLTNFDQAVDDWITSRIEID